MWTAQTGKSGGVCFDLGVLALEERDGIHHVKVHLSRKVLDHQLGEVVHKLSVVQRTGGILLQELLDHAAWRGKKKKKERKKEKKRKEN